MHAFISVNAFDVHGVALDILELSFLLEFLWLIYREYVYSAVVYQKYLTRLRELIIFEPWRENYHFSQPS